MRIADMRRGSTARAYRHDQVALELEDLVGVAVVEVVIEDPAETLPQPNANTNTDQHQRESTHSASVPSTASECHAQHDEARKAAVRASRSCAGCGSSRRPRP
eukprot:694829-Rhodomonas_salina.5